MVFAVPYADPAALPVFDPLQTLDDRTEPVDQFATAWHLLIKVTLGREVAIGVLAFVLANDRNAFAEECGEGHLGFAKRV
jgi:hypothetical protein